MTDRDILDALTIAYLRERLRDWWRRLWGGRKKS
jgi:hypothetical protein